MAKSKKTRPARVRVIRPTHEQQIENDMLIAQNTADFKKAKGTDEGKQAWESGGSVACAKNETE